MSIYKIAAAAVLSLGLATAAFASSTFNFAAATDGTYLCGTYCTGYTTDSADTVSFVNVQSYGTQYRVTMTIDGTSYQGYSAGSGAQFTALSASGGYALVSVTWTSKTTCVRSGRGQHCTSWYYAVAGTVSQ